MICPQCKTANDDEYVFCVNCGIPIGDDAYRTAKFDPTPITKRAPLPETVFVREAQFRQTTPPYQPVPPIEIYKEDSRPSRVPLIVGITVLALAIASGAVYYAGLPTVRPPDQSNIEVLPEYLGLFWQKDNKRSVVEIKKYDFAGVAEAKETLLKDNSIIFIDSHPELILYADAAEVPLSDLKFIRLDTITNDGKVKFIDFQAALVEGKPAMKRIRFEKPVENGRYAFALFSGFFEDGRHKLWPVEIRGSNAPTGQFIQELALSLKPKVVDTPTKVDPEDVPIPPGVTVAYSTGKDVRIRKRPVQGDDKNVIGGLELDQKVYVIKRSKGEANSNESWAFIQTEDGKRGWVFDGYLRNEY